MKLVIAVVGRLKDRYLETGVDDYLKRVRRYCAVDLVRIKEERKTKAQYESQAIEKEGEKILQLVKPGDKLLALSEEGRQFDSEQWAEQMDQWFQTTPGRLILAIGSGPGLSPTVKQEADILLSLSPLTFPHQLAYLLLLEQLYRGFSILNGEPYHRG